MYVYVLRACRHNLIFQVHHVLFENVLASDSPTVSTRLSSERSSSILIKPNQPPAPTSGNLYENIFTYSRRTHPPPAHSIKTAAHPILQRPRV